MIGGDAEVLRLDQRFRYEYPGPIADLRHRLMVIPPRRHGGQRRLGYGLAVRDADAVVTARRDRFGNHRYEIRSHRVDEAIEFEAWVVVEQDSAPGPFLVREDVAGDRRLHAPSALTRPDDALAAAARELGCVPERNRSSEGRPIEVAERVTSWVHGAMRFGTGSTHVQTTAAEALALGQGVCQDYAHIMLAIVRLCGVAARYASGHLVGEGGSHAWVEVVVPDDSQPGRALVVPFDPTHNRRAGVQYVTIAVGRDYADVAPTSGTFRAACSGRLSCRKRLEAAGPLARTP